VSTGRKPPTPEPPRWDSLGGFVPEGYWYLHEMVELVAKWGSQGRLPRALGFVHPGDTVDELLDQPAVVVARDVLGQKLAAGVLTAEAFLDPSGRQAPLPAIYWRSSSGRATMQDRNSAIDLRRFPDIQNEVASAILHIDAVMAAFGLRPSEPEVPIAAEQPPPAPAPPPSVPAATPEPLAVDTPHTPVETTPSPIRC
jgi:hypothetical protein